jgi:outer membrane protein assembly factor BamB
MSRTSIIAVVALALAPAVLPAEEWPGWRGPRADGIASDVNLPLRWSATENVAWKTPIPGKGHSSPVVWGDHVFLTTCLEDSGKRLLLALDRRGGKVRWEREIVTAPLERKHGLNSYASSTPVTDGKHVWVTFFAYPDLVVACYDFEGNLAWKMSPGRFFSRHGFCASPLLYENLLIINADQDPPDVRVFPDAAKYKKEAYLVALDKSTGEQVWRTPRPNIRSYCPPVVFDIAGKKQLVIAGAECVASYDPATGKQIWKIDGPTEQFVASLVQGNGVLFMTYGFPKRGVLGIKPDGTGNVTATHVLYNEIKGGGYVPSPVAAGEWFFLVNDEGIATCREAKTGELLWQERLGKHHSASPIAANGYLYFPDDNGITWVLKAGPEFEVVARNELGDECYASFAASRGQIFIRTLQSLWCIGKETQP